MPKINLLPTRAAAKREAIKRELLLALAAVVFVIFALALWQSVVASSLQSTAARAQALGAEVGELQLKVTQIDTFKSQASLLEKKLAIIDTLARARFGPARMLDALADSVACQPRIWLTEFVEKDGVLKLAGGAMDQEDVSAFHLDLSRRTAFFRDVKLNLVNVNRDGEATSLTWTLQCTPHDEAS